MGMERSGIAAGGTIKKGLHKTPTTVFVPQLFDARRLLRGTAQLILHENIGRNGVEGEQESGRRFPLSLCTSLG